MAQLGGGGGTWHVAFFGNSALRHCVSVGDLGTAMATFTFFQPNPLGSLLYTELLNKILLEERVLLLKKESP